MLVAGGNVMCTHCKVRSNIEACCPLLRYLQLTPEFTQVIENGASGRGGGIAETGGTSDWAGGVVAGNVASMHGGGIAAVGGSIHITPGLARFMVANNTAVSGHGGGMYLVQVHTRVAAVVCFALDDTVVSLVTHSLGTSAKRPASRLWSCEQTPRGEAAVACLNRGTTRTRPVIHCPSCA